MAAVQGSLTQGSSQRMLGSCITYCGTYLISTALLIIACIAAAGGMSGVAAGGSIVGLSIPLLIANLMQAKGYHQEGKKLHRAAVGYVAITFLVATILGSMAIAGAVPASAAGWGYLAPILISIPLSYCLPCIFPREVVKTYIEWISWCAELAGQKPDDAKAFAVGVIGPILAMSGLERLLPGDER